MDMRHSDYDNGYSDQPYFERLETNEYIELQESRRIIEVLLHLMLLSIHTCLLNVISLLKVLHHRVRSLENINIDLEYRLEQQAKATFLAEQRYADIDKAWKEKYLELQTVCDAVWMRW